MKTINATKGELVNIINGLFAVQELKGKTFSLTVSKNISILRDTLKDVEEAGKPSPEFLEIAQKVNEIANENKEDAKEQIDKIEEDNKELPSLIAPARVKSAVKLPEALNTATPVLTSPVETSDAEENGFSLKL
jgi:hypothetical protein